MFCVNFIVVNDCLYLKFGVVTTHIVSMVPLLLILNFALIHRKYLFKYLAKVTVIHIQPKLVRMNYDGFACVFSLVFKKICGLESHCVSQGGTLN